MVAARPTSPSTPHTGDRYGRACSGRRPGVPLLLAGVAGSCHRPVARLWPLTRGWSPPGRLRALALVPIIRLVGDVAKMIGYPVGLWWRWRHPRRDQTAPALKEFPHDGYG